MLGVHLRACPVQLLPRPLAAEQAGDHRLPGPPAEEVEDVVPDDGPGDGGSGHAQDRQRPWSASPTAEMITASAGTTTAMSAVVRMATTT
jgi:hypothetical protein